MGRSTRDLNGFGADFRVLLWHELGHAFGFRLWGTPTNDSDFLRNLRMTLIFENAARRQSPDMRPFLGPSKYNTQHCEEGKGCIEVWPTGTWR